ncbi:MAG TPA: glycoside hydrolase family 3 N-terminal domain-containing protein [Rhizomicrobium sp.]|jgi:beta-glucosidase|nr:glycoside hydrolase family 3 N-terminal domain-containing protein [Rhizomicrobium sp.]
MRGFTAGLCVAAATMAALAISDAAPKAHKVAPAAAPAANAAPLYKDPNAPIPARVEDLLKRMTLEEKVAQIDTVWNNKDTIFDADGNFDAAKASAQHPDGIGQIARPGDLEGTKRTGIARGTRETTALIDAIQHWAVEKTRLGIPVWFHDEGLHGAVVVNGTSFPQAIALASTFDPDLVRRVNAVTGRELAARGVQEALSPVVDVARDPRWGRIEETFGEDPYLCGEMGVAAVEGLQGDALPLAPGKVFATLKHMTGHGQPESGTNVGPAPFGERTIREFFLPPFEEVVHRTNVRAVMASYNEVDGVPSHVNTWLLGTVLRGEWGYKGAVVSDYFAIEQLTDIHHVVPDHAAGAVRALRAGVDVDNPNGASFGTLVASVKAGKVSEKEIDTAVRRFLTVKFQAGLFEHPFHDVDAADALTGNADADALATEAARRAAVLLKNDGTLPLSKSVKTLAVIGPNAASIHLGGYSSVPRHTVTVLDGIKAKLGPAANIVTAEGVKITESNDWNQDDVKLADPAENRKRIAQAVDVAKKADTIVLVLGDTEETSREAWADNHLGDRDDLNLVGQQDELADAIFALGKPVVVVLINGRPLSVVNVAAKANALVEGWYLGQDTGTAMADILFGDANPGGHLPVTIARSVGQLPMFYNYKPSAHRGYLFDTTAPLFPFGFGLSYTTFDVSAPRLSASTIKPNGTVTVSVDVKNTGTRAGDEVVQLYLHQQVASVTRPVKELKGFQRVTLAPGEQKTVTFSVGPHELRMYNQQMQRVVEPGAFDIMSGDNSAVLKTTVLTVAG